MDNVLIRLPLTNLTIRAREDMVRGQILSSYARTYDSSVGTVHLVEPYRGDGIPQDIALGVINCDCKNGDLIRERDVIASVVGVAEVRRSSA